MGLLVLRDLAQDVTRPGPVAVSSFSELFMQSPHRTAASVRAILLLVVTLALPAGAAAQGPDSFAVGARVRVERPEVGAGWHEGKLVMLSPDSAAVEMAETSDTVAFPRDTVGRFEWSQGLHTRTGKSALLGLGIGAGAGLLVGIAASVDSCTALCYEVGPAEILGAAAILGGVGAGLGALIGSQSRGERWTPVAPPHAGAAVRPMVRGRNVGLALRF
jgi:hypothetical protein